MQGTFVLIGDDYIADFDWQQRIPFFEIHNFGKRSEQVEELLLRIDDIEKNIPNPHVILLMTGTNNVVAKDYTFVDQIRRLVIRLSNHYPGAEIIVNSLPAIKTHFLVENAVSRLNENLSNMARQTGCCYLDVFDKLANGHELIFERDGIRLTDSTYDRWARSFLEFVAFLYEDG